jgi:hypothetical protein
MKGLPDEIFADKKSIFSTLMLKQLTIKVPQLATNVEALYLLLDCHWEESGHEFPYLD